MRDNILPSVGFVSEIASTSGFVKSSKFEVRGSQVRFEASTATSNIELQTSNLRIFKLHSRIHVLIITNQELQYE